jgi:hypothetical protein
MSNLKSLAASVIQAMKDRKMLRTDGFSLHAGFTGSYQVNRVEATASKSEGSDDNFRLHTSSSTGSHSLPGFMIVNAFIVPKNVAMPTEFVKSDRPNCFFYEQSSDLIRQCTRMHQAFGQDGFDFPDSLEIVGAMVQKDSSGEHPYVPLRRYPFYSTLLSFHKTKVADATYIDRETISMYLADQSAGRVNVPKDFQFKLRNHAIEVWEYRNWNPTLFIRDWR